MIFLVLTRVLRWTSHEEDETTQAIQLCCLSFLPEGWWGSLHVRIRCDLLILSKNNSETIRGCRQESLSFWSGRHWREGSVSIASWSEHRHGSVRVWCNCHLPLEGIVSRSCQSFFKSAHLIFSGKGLGRPRSYQLSSAFFLGTILRSLFRPLPEHGMLRTPAKLPKKGCELRLWGYEGSVETLIVCFISFLLTGRFTCLWYRCESNCAPWSFLTYTSQPQTEQSQND